MEWYLIEGIAGLVVALASYRRGVTVTRRKQLRKQEANARYVIQAHHNTK